MSRRTKRRSRRKSRSGSGRSRSKSSVCSDPFLAEANMYGPPFAQVTDPTCASMDCFGVSSYGGCDPAIVGGPYGGMYGMPFGGAYGCYSYESQFGEELADGDDVAGAIRGGLGNPSAKVHKSNINSLGGRPSDAVYCAVAQATNISAAELERMVKAHLAGHPTWFAEDRDMILKILECLLQFKFIVIYEDDPTHWKTCKDTPLWKLAKKQTLKKCPWNMIFLLISSENSMPTLLRINKAPIFNTSHSSDAAQHGGLGTTSRLG